MTLTNDEMAVLMIAARGDYMLAIGRWEAPTKSLAAKGFMKREMINDGPQYMITDAGRAAMEKGDDDNIRAMIEHGSQIGAAHKNARDCIEQAAQLLVEAARAGSVVGDRPRAALERWRRPLFERALEILNG